MLFTRKPEYELHPAGEWKAQFVEWKETAHEKFGIQCQLTFETEVETEEGELRKISRWCKPSLHPKGAIYGLLIALGVNPDQDITDEQLQAGWDLDPYIGQKLRLQIAHEPKKDNPKEFRDCIKAFLPFKRGNVRTSSKFQEEPAETPAKEPVGAAAGANKQELFGDDED